MILLISISPIRFGIRFYGEEIVSMAPYVIVITDTFMFTAFF